MTTYYIHYTDGTKESRHWCDMCDEREAVFFEAHERKEHADKWQQTEHEQVCRECWQDM